MNTASDFRGLAGEVVAGFMRPRTFLTMFPVAIVGVLCYAVLGLLSLRIPGVATLFFMLLISAFFVGKFAIPAAYGDLQAGVLSPYSSNMAALAYAGRYVAIVVASVTPLYIIMHLTAGDGASLVGGIVGGFSPVQITGMGALAVLNIMAAIAALIGISVAYIVAAAANSMADIFRLDVWKWVLFARGADVLVLAASTIGGALLFLIVYAVPILLIAGLAFAASTELGTLTMVLFPLCLAAGSPILLGRLCGAFVTASSTAASGGAVIEVTNSGAVLSDEADEPKIAALTEDPSDQTVEWVRSQARQYEAVQEAVLFIEEAAGKTTWRVGWILSADTPVGKRREIANQLSAAAANSNTVQGAEDLRGARLEEARAKGLLIYRRKG